MKLFRFGKTGSERPGVALADDKWLDISGFGEDIGPSFLGGGGIDRLRDWLKTHFATCPAVDRSERLGPCLANPSKIICIGLNYAKHAAESGMQVPSEPVIFFKATTAITGPFDDVTIPKGSKKTDWEVEVAVVIGRRASYVEERDAMSYVAGYCLHNDYSEREYQLERGGQWVKGKSCDTFAPIGPWFVTADEIPDPHNLRLWLKVNNEMVQDSSTSDLIFRIPKLVSYLSQFMTLLPGDLISTGTPSGVGLGFKPPRFLNPGDVVELGADRLGVSRQRLIAWGAAS